MFYNEYYQHLHIHNPKTGGKSLMFSVSKNQKGWKRDYPMHIKLNNIENAHIELFNKVKDYTKTVTVRNPWDHAVSYYYHALCKERFFKENFFSIKGFKNMNENQKTNLDLSFSSFINNGYHNYIQNHFLKNSKNLKFDIVFKYEEYDKILSFFEEKYNTLIDKNFNHHSRNRIQTVNNIQIVDDYRKLYNTETIDKVAVYSQEIIKKYNYTFE